MTNKKKLEKHIKLQQHSVTDLTPIELDSPRANAVKNFMIKQEWEVKPKKKERFLKKSFPEGVSEGVKKQTASYIPVNVSLGEYSDQILPFKVTEYFIKKAGTIVLMDCACRIENKCKNHDIHLGCVWMGEAAKHIDFSRWPVSNGRIATKEEALELERLAYENGLIPGLGKLRDDAKLYGVLDYEDQLMSICHCCSCCCVLGLIKYGPGELRQVHKRMEGVEVRVDLDKCIGCGQCFKVCIFDARKMENGKAVINQENCMGCGRCEMICPNKAVTVSIDDYSHIDELIARYESRVDISG